MGIFGEGHWFQVQDSDPRAVGLYSRHYSAEKSGKTVADWLRSGFSGPGETIMFLTAVGGVPPERGGRR